MRINLQAPSSTARLIELNLFSQRNFGRRQKLKKYTAA